MKTTTVNIEFLSATKLFAFIILISGLAFFTSIAVNAQLSNEVTPIYFVDKQYEDYTTILQSDIELSGIDADQLWAARLQSALVTVPEARLEVESWMLNAEFTAEVYEEALEVEYWMFEAAYTTEVYEEVLEVESWMLE